MDPVHRDPDDDIAVAGASLVQVPVLSAVVGRVVVVYGVSQALRVAGLKLIALTLIGGVVTVVPSWLWLAFVVATVLACFASGAATCLSDPGILPPPFDAPSLASGEQKHNELLALPAYRSDWTLPFCRTCRHLRPARASHCRLCNVCVMGHDHHCYVLGCCIGGRNIRWFLLYQVTYVVAAWMLMYDAVLPSMAKARALAAWWHPVCLAHLFVLVVGIPITFAASAFLLYFVTLVVRGKTARRRVTEIRSAEEEAEAMTAAAPREPEGGLRASIAAILWPPASLLATYEELALQRQQPV